MHLRRIEADLSSTTCLLSQPKMQAMLSTFKTTCCLLSCSGTRMKGSKSPISSRVVDLSPNLFPLLSVPKLIISLLQLWLKAKQISPLSEMPMEATPGPSLMELSLASPAASDENSFLYTGGACGSLAIGSHTSLSANMPAHVSRSFLD